MYAIFYSNKRLLFITAKDRNDLNCKVDKVNRYMDLHLNDYKEIYQERNFSDKIHNFRSFLEKRPKFKDYKRQNLKTFCL